MRGCGEEEFYGSSLAANVGRKFGGVCRFAVDGLVEDQRKEKNGVPF
jgi:hypothetical protein